jgi:hypothetical protein
MCIHRDLCRLPFLRAWYCASRCCALRAPCDTSIHPCSSHDVVVLDFWIRARKTGSVELTFFLVSAGGAVQETMQCLTLSLSQLHDLDDRELINWFPSLQATNELDTTIARKHAPGVVADDTAMVEVRAMGWKRNAVVAPWTNWLLACVFSTFPCIVMRASAGQRPACGVPLRQRRPWPADYLRGCPQQPDGAGQEHGVLGIHSMRHTLANSDPHGGRPGHAVENPSGRFVTVRPYLRIGLWHLSSPAQRHAQFCGQCARRCRRQTLGHGPLFSNGPHENP